MVRTKGEYVYMVKELLISNNSVIINDFSRYPDRITYDPIIKDTGGIRRGGVKIIASCQTYKVIYLDLYLVNSIGIAGVRYIYDMINESSNAKVMLYSSHALCGDISCEQLDLIIRTVRKCTNNYNLCISKICPGNTDENEPRSIEFFDTSYDFHTSEDKNTRLKVFLDLPLHTFCVGEYIVYTADNNKMYFGIVSTVTSTYTLVAENEVERKCIRYKDDKNLQVVDEVQPVKSPCITREDCGKFKVKVIERKISMQGSIKYVTADGRVYDKGEIQILPMSLDMSDKIVNELSK